MITKCDVLPLIINFSRSYRKARNDDSHGKWKIKKVDHVKQADSVSCGLFCMVVSILEVFY